MKDLLSIGEAAKFLGVSIDTLRRWDKKGKLKARRMSGEKHRRYSMFEIKMSQNDLFKLATDWVRGEPTLPAEDFYCPNSAVFQTRLVKIGLDNSLIVAVAGEIGNNSFDHNLGNWPDVSGIFFGYDLNKRQIALADRGQGILKTLSRVRPELKNDEEALRVAFTEIVSGRAPEERGNGLKFVRSVIAKNPFSLIYQTGEAICELKQGGGEVLVKKAEWHINGCLALLSY